MYTELYTSLYCILNCSLVHNVYCILNCTLVFTVYGILNCTLYTVYWTLVYTAWMHWLLPWLHITVTLVNIVQCGPDGKMVLVRALFTLPSHVIHRALILHLIYRAVLSPNKCMTTLVIPVYLYWSRKRNLAKLYMVYLRYQILGSFEASFKQTRAKPGTALQTASS